MPDMPQIQYKREIRPTVYTLDVQRHQDGSATLAVGLPMEGDIYVLSLNSEMAADLKAKLGSDITIAPASALPKEKLL